MDKLQQLEQTAKELQKQIQELKNESRKFKIGDTIRHSNDNSIVNIISIKQDRYIVDFNGYVLFSGESKWELVPKKAIWWEPKDGEKLYYIRHDGSIKSSNIIEEKYYTKDIVFRTQEEVEKERDLRQATYRLKKAIFELNGGYIKWYWSDYSRKYCITLYCGEIHKTYFTVSKTFPSWYYLKNADDRDKLIASHKEDLLIFLNQ